MATTTSNAQLAQLLSESYQKIDRLNESLAAEKHRAEHYQRIAESSSSPQNGHGADLLLERVRVAEECAYIAERQRDEEVVQRETITRLTRSSKLLSDAAIPALQTHILTPVITGAPSKKARNNSNSQMHASPDAASTSTTSLVSAFGEPTKIYAAVNELGQRTCRNCGNTGWYKEDKCVEKWGHGTGNHAKRKSSDSNTAGYSCPSIPSSSSRGIFCLLPSSRAQSQNSMGVMPIEGYRAANIVDPSR
ncbi:hypothetical protein BDZ89DRAFT_1120461 [Hymenopellis radicata]|nr:hypothetical protein BDZ89DRAFT_1120461 [Hymenopellis radicata]